MNKLLILFFSLGISLALCESFLRITIPFSRKLQLLTGEVKTPKTAEGFENIDELLASLNSYTKPGQLVNGFYANSKGFLTEELAYKKTEGKYRIVALGDSFGVGVVPYEHQYLRLLANDLSNSWNNNVELINLSVSSIGPKIYRDIFFLEGQKYQPDLVLISFFVGNDFIDDQAIFEYHPNLKAKNDNLSTEKKQIFNSKIAQLIKGLVDNRRLQNASARIVDKDTRGDILGTYTGEGKDQYNPEDQTLGKKTYEMILNDKLGQEFNISVDSLSRKNKYDPIAINNIKEIKQQSMSIGAETIVIIIPDELQLNDSLWNEGVARTGIDPHYLDRRSPQLRLIEALEKENIKYIDLLSEMSSSSDSANFYQPADTHFNIKGNAEAARIISSYLKEKL